MDFVLVSDKKRMLFSHQHINLLALLEACCMYHRQLHTAICNSHLPQNYEVSTRSATMATKNVTSSTAPEITLPSSLYRMKMDGADPKVGDFRDEPIGDNYAVC
jgi:hypothetical protein